MDYLEKSEEITGYKVKIMHKGAFKIRGYTLIIPPAQEENLVGKFWDDTLGDGRVERLIGAAPSPTWLLGLGSWDPECEKHGFRYTICIEDTGQTDFSGLEKEQPLFSKEIGESDWMCFMMTHDRFTERFMKDDPYRMLKLLGISSTRAIAAWACTSTPTRPVLTPSPILIWNSGSRSRRNRSRFFDRRFHLLRVLVDVVGK